MVKHWTRLKSVLLLVMFSDASFKKSTYPLVSFLRPFWSGNINLNGIFFQISEIPQGRALQ